MFDTNGLVAAFVVEGVCSKILQRAQKTQFHLVVCPIILQEFGRVLLKNFFAIREEVRDALQVVLEATHSTIHPSQLKQSVCRDPDDDAILACALEAKADYLVTGDMDLIELKAFKRLRIVSPRDFELLFKD